LTKIRGALETFYGRLERQGEDTVTPKQERPPVGLRRAAASDSSGPRTVTRSKTTKPKRPAAAAKKRFSETLA
jgi:hypothetical protein